MARHSDPPAPHHTLHLALSIDRSGRLSVPARRAVEQPPVGAPLARTGALQQAALPIWRIASLLRFACIETTTTRCESSLSRLSRQRRALRRSGFAAMQEANREQAHRSREIAEAALAAGDLERASRFANKALRLFPHDEVRLGSRRNWPEGPIGAGSPQALAPLQVAPRARPASPLHRWLRSTAVADRSPRLQRCHPSHRSTHPRRRCRFCRLLTAAFSPLLMPLQARVLLVKVKNAAERASSSSAGARAANPRHPSGMGSGPNLRQRHAAPASSGGASSSRRPEPPADEDHKVKLLWWLPSACRAASADVLQLHLLPDALRCADPALPLTGMLLLPTSIHQPAARPPRSSGSWLPASEPPPASMKCLGFSGAPARTTSKRVGG